MFHSYKLHIKRAISLLLAVIIILCACSCSYDKSQNEIPNGAETIVDASGQTLAIPQNSEDITIASVYAVAVPFLAALECTDKVAAINCKSHFWTDEDENLKNAGTVGRGVVDLEALASYNPTVLIHRANDSKTVEAVEKLGVDVLSISAEDIDGIYNTLEIMGKYLGKEERASEVINWMDAKFDEIDTIASAIPQSERKTAIVMGGEIGKIAGGDMLQSYLIEKAGGISAASDIKNNGNWTLAGTEMIFKLNPDFIFCTGSTPLDYATDELLNEPTWSSLNAVKNKNVSVIPAKIDPWDMPGIAPVLGAFWMLNQMYPEYFSSEELQKEIDEYYTFMFGRAFSCDYLGY